MMINMIDVKKLADLARIEIHEAEIQSLEEDLTAIVAYVSKIEGAESFGEGSTHTDLRNVMRGDENPFESEMFTEEILNNVPAQEGGYLKVKKIL